MASKDLSHTPSERAAALLSTAAPTSDAGLFDAAAEVEIGGPQHIVIIGAGLVGALCAVVLLRKGFKVHLFERYPDIRSIPSLGRSINLSVTSRGLRAIKALGGTLYDDILRELATKIRGRIIHMADGKVIFQRYGKDDTECNYSISRLDLNKFLLDVAGREGADLHFNHALSDTSDFTSPGMIGCKLHFCRSISDKPETREALRVSAACPVIACDGAGSRVRYALRRSGLTSFTEDVLPRGYKEILFPKPTKDFGAMGHDGSEACEGFYGLHIWPRGEHMLMALANRDGSFTGTIYMDNDGPEESFAAFNESPEGRSKCAAFCERFYSDAAPLVGGMDAMVDQIVTKPTGILGTVRSETWAVTSKVVMIGDAAHAMVPFFGQGCNCGFEDILWLSRLLDQHCCEGERCSLQKCTGENFSACFAALESERKPNAFAICDMALENFVEMRDKSGDTTFQAMKKVENQLENMFPDKFRSRYAMVCYGGEGNVSYANAKELGEVQTTILERVCTQTSGSRHDDTQPTFDVALAEHLIDDELVPRQKRLRVDLTTVRH